ncbi:MAG: DegT/DnrJ/EryC1/StrS family aminotransferase [Rhodospirillales bacterium]|nr:DegT/DnrJ/EryC1/StrS family aminotransferase [Rhodospirillales bacterium]
MPNNDRLLAAVHDSIRAYCEANHDFGFKANDPVVRLHEPTFSADEIAAAVDVLLSTRVTMGPKVKGFEREYADKFGFTHAVMNNSGSSANLLAVAALVNPATKDHLKSGDEVIVPALSWSTTVWPLVQHNLVPVIVDIDPLTLNADPSEIERAIGPKTRGIMPVHVYGNPCDMGAIMDICKRRNLALVEDCCEALGAFYDGKPVGKFGRVGTFSFYFSHHMTTLEGGICVTDDFEFAEVMRMLRAHGWTRELEDRERYLKAYPHIDPKFLFVNVGYNLRATELQGAFGSVQLPKLDGFVERRRENTAVWRRDLDRWGKFFMFQTETPRGKSSCFGFPMTLKADAPFKVGEFMAFLNAARIETRPIIAGNIAVQPAMKLFQHRVVGDLRHSNRVMEGGVSFGNHQAVDEAARDYVTGNVGDFMRTKGLA